MNISDHTPSPRPALELPARRRFFGRSGGLVLSAAAIGPLAGRDSLAADETMHWTALVGAMAHAVPAQARSFGA